MLARPHSPAEMFARVGNHHPQSATDHHRKEQRQPNGRPAPGQRRLGRGHDPGLGRWKCLLLDCLGVTTEIFEGVVRLPLCLSGGKETLKLSLAHAIELSRILSPEVSHCLVGPVYLRFQLIEATGKPKTRLGQFKILASN